MEKQTDETTIQDEKQAIEQACVAGDLSSLKTLLRNANPHHMDIYDVLTTAVVHEHTNIVAYLLKTYPKHSLSQHIKAAESLARSGNVSILKLLLAHDPRFANISLDYGLREFITDACAYGPPSKVGPLIEMLLDGGAAVNEGWFHGGALLAALHGEQRKDIIVKIVRKGAWINSSHIGAAIDRLRVDVLPFLLRRAQEGVLKDEELLKQAKKKGNIEVKDLIEAYIAGGVKEMVRYEKEGEKEARKMTGWWKFWKYWQ